MLTYLCCGGFACSAKVEPGSWEPGWYVLFSPRAESWWINTISGPCNESNWICAWTRNDYLGIFWFVDNCTVHASYVFCRLFDMILSINRTHTYTRLTALCLRLPGWAGTKKIKTIWILLKQGTVSGSGINWAICKSAPRSIQITTPAHHHSVFYRPDAFLPPNQQHQSTEGLSNLSWIFFFLHLFYIISCLLALQVSIPSSAVYVIKGTSKQILYLI